MLRILSLSLVVGVSLLAQSTATLRGIVSDAQSAPVPGAVAVLHNSLTGFSQQVRSADDGTFQFTNIPFQTYTLAVQRDGFQPSQQIFSLRTNVPQDAQVRLVLAAQLAQIDVLATESLQLVDPESTGTRTELSATAISHLPVAPTSRGLESVLLTFPGFAANANGAIHPRGAHNQMTYVVDGMPISDQLTGAFANAVDPSIVQTVELFTGNVPPEFGSKISGVAVITTKSGMGTGRRFSGSTQFTAAQFDTFSNVTQFAGGAEKWGYFVSFNALKSNRYLDQVSLDNLHNGGNSERTFARADYQVSSHDQVRLNFLTGRSSFQLANLRSQHARGQDQRQTLVDYSGSVGWLHTIDSRSTFDQMVSFRTAQAQLIPSPGDYPISASQDRTASMFTTGSRWNRDSGRHAWRIGFDYQRFPIREQFTLNNFIDPPRHFQDARTGQQFSPFLQDTMRMGRLIVSLGLRWDAYRFLEKGNQLQPRIGLAYHLRETGTVLRASYNRTYQTPPNENLLLSSSGVAIRPERQNVYEVGLQQSLGSMVSFSGAFYHKDSRDMQDNDNFLNTGIIFPTSLAFSRTNGAEGRFTLVPTHGFSGSLSFTHYHTIVTPPFTGGLFIGSGAIGQLSSGPFVIDHDQVLGVQGNAQYNIRPNLWISGSIRYDSGLVSNPSDPAQVAADPDYADLLPYVNLLSDPPRVRPRTITDLAIGYERQRSERRAWEVVAQVSNLTNSTALYNFQSIFVGTRLVQPRTASIRWRLYF